MEPEKPARIRIEDLPPLEQLTPEEMEALLGAGRVQPRLGIESLESREMLDGSLTANLAGGVLNVQDTQAGDQIHLRRLSDQVSVDGIAIQVGGTSQASVPAGAVGRIEVHTPAGNDRVWLGDAGQPLGLPASLLDRLAGDTVFTAANPGGVVLQSGDQAVAIATNTSGQQAVFRLGQDGTVSELTASGWATRAGTGVGGSPVTQMASVVDVAGTPRVTILQANGALSVMGPSGWSTIAGWGSGVSPVTAMVQSTNAQGQPAVGFLQGGTLFVWDGQHPPTTDVSALNQTDANDLAALARSGFWAAWVVNAAALGLPAEATAHTVIAGTPGNDRAGYFQFARGVLVYISGMTEFPLLGSSPVQLQQLVSSTVVV